MSPSASLPLLAGRLTLSQALDDEGDVLQKLTYPDKRLDFCGLLYAHAKDIEAIVSHHLGVPRDVCLVPWVDEWIHGSFNICIPVYVRGEKRVMIRFPLPYKIGEAASPGNADEKLRCEVATYAWMQSRCPSVPIPRLWGFGFPHGPSFTCLARAPLFARLRFYVRRSLRWVLRRPCPFDYVPHAHRHGFSSGYLIVDYVRGQMLSETWDTLRYDAKRRKTLYRDISNVMLSMGSFPFPRIGSLAIDDHGVVELRHRPLTFHLHQLENEGVRTNFPRDLTQATSDTYVLDLLACHDNRLRYRPNTIIDHADGQSQLSVLTIMRALLPHFFDRHRRHGPFVLMLTDLHPSNMFVDNNWHISCLIDLEWACARPTEMLHPPHWLTGRAIDQIAGEHLAAYGEQHDEFLSIFETEERKRHGTAPLAQTMRKGWETGNFWYFNALDSLSGLYTLFLQHILPLYGQAASENWRELERVVAPYWAPGSSSFLDDKVVEREHYKQQIEEAFRQTGESEPL